MRKAVEKDKEKSIIVEGEIDPTLRGKPVKPLDIPPA
jgi:hypothetical protein